MSKSVRCRDPEPLTRAVEDEVEVLTLEPVPVPDAVVLELVCDDLLVPGVESGVLVEFDM